MTAAIPRACVIGWPIAHSRSPLIHGYWLEHYGIAGSYGIRAVEPAELPSFLAGFADSGLVGANVTVPHKEGALAACAHLEPVAVSIGAVNTLWLDGGKLCGTNTDAVGFLANLDAAAAGWDASPRTALVLGAGGAARAVVWGLLGRGFRVLLVNRTRSRAEELAARMRGDIRVHDWAEIPRLLSDSDLLVNTTALGMSGKEPLEIDLAPLKRGALVNDLVYVPLETPLLAAARAAGHPVVDGLGMLLHQAAPGFERWFGRRPEVTEALRARIVADLEAKAR